MKATAVAPANIAFIKYWGKADPPAGEAGAALRLPLNSSISMNLSECTTTTTVEFSPLYEEDIISGLQNDSRVTEHVDRLREIVGTKLRAKIATKNSFPSGTGIASSASGFAALTAAAAAALGLSLSEKELSILARLGSGSACRSIPDGFVEWQRGNNSQTSYAHSLYPSDYWDLRDIIIVVEEGQKKIGSTQGMDKVRTSPFIGKRLRDIPDRIKEVKRALAQKDIERLGTAMEEDCISMHAVTMTQKPPVFYWSGKTMDIIRAVYEWRAHGVGVYFTIDAGPNVHLICEAKNEQAVVEKIKQALGELNIIINRPARGAHVV